MALTVSVALCTHNGERFLAAQLDSILAQNRPVDEIVLSDDASTDGTLAIAQATIDAYLDRTPDSALRFTVLRNQPALGVTQNFEQAIRACSGDVLLLSDQDDLWSVERVEASIGAMGDDRTVLLVHSDARLIDELGADLGATLFGAYGVDESALRTIADGGGFELFLRRNLVTGATVALRRELAAAAVPFPSAWVHDEWLAIVAASIGRIVPLRDHLIDYRQHSSNVIGAVSLTFRGKLARLFAQGAERNRRLLERAEQLAQRYPQFGSAVTAGGVDSVRRNVEHEQVRASLSPHRLARITPVLAEARTGRYREFGGGLQDVVRDLVQPLKPAS